MRTLVQSSLATYFTQLGLANYARCRIETSWSEAAARSVDERALTGAQPSKSASQTNFGHYSVSRFEPTRESVSGASVGYVQRSPTLGWNQMTAEN